MKKKNDRNPDPKEAARTFAIATAVAAVAFFYNFVLTAPLNETLGYFLRLPSSLILIAYAFSAPLFLAMFGMWGCEWAVILKDRYQYQRRRQGQR